VKLKKMRLRDEMREEQHEILENKQNLENGFEVP
jgi:hypothetical protein